MNQSAENVILVLFPKLLVILMLKMCNPFVWENMKPENVMKNI